MSQALFKSPLKFSLLVMTTRVIRHYNLGCVIVSIFERLKYCSFASLKPIAGMSWAIQQFQFGFGWSYLSVLQNCVNHGHPNLILVAIVYISTIINTCGLNVVVQCLTFKPQFCNPLFTLPRFTWSLVWFHKGHLEPKNFEVILLTFLLESHEVARLIITTISQFLLVLMCKYFLTYGSNNCVCLEVQLQPCLVYSHICSG